MNSRIVGLGVEMAEGKAEVGYVEWVGDFYSRTWSSKQVVCPGRSGFELRFHTLLGVTLKQSLKLLCSSSLNSHYL